MANQCIGLMTYQPSESEHMKSLTYLIRVVICYTFLIENGNLVVQKCEKIRV